MLTNIEKQEIKDNIRRMIDEFRHLRGLPTDIREHKYKEILDYLLTKPLFISSNPKFKRAVLTSISNNAHQRGFITPIIDYNYYNDIIRNLPSLR